MDGQQSVLKILRGRGRARARFQNAKRGLFSSSMSSTFANSTPSISLKEQEKNSMKHVDRAFPDTAERRQYFHSGNLEQTGNGLSHFKIGGAQSDLIL